MLEYEQQFIDNCICPVCSEISIKSIYYVNKKKMEPRKFITNAQDPNKCCCSKCGYSTTIKGIKRCELNDGGQNEGN